LIQEGIRIAREANANNEKKYFILLIVTDGQIHDMDSAKAAIIEASTLPISIVVIGLGDEPTKEHFDQMRILDSDGKMLEFGDRIASRDIVQFVPYASASKSNELFIKELMAEVRIFLFVFLS
jgi:hypothetical protein